MEKNNSKLFWCKNCVVMSTRPRTTFDNRGFCSACVWAEEKKKLNWKMQKEKVNYLIAATRLQTKMTEPSVSAEVPYFSLNQFDTKLNIIIAPAKESNI